VVIEELFLAEKYPDRDYIKGEYDGSYALDGKALTMTVSGQENEITGIIQDDGSIIIDGEKCSLAKDTFKSKKINEALGITNTYVESASGQSTIGEISYVIPDSWEANSSNSDYARDYYKYENNKGVAQISMRFGSIGSPAGSWEKEL
ncbi:hypothetical protein, partial [Pseudomonas aeruginosa]